MIEIRMNNGVIEYRHQLDINWDNGVVRKAPVWGEWRKAEYFGRAFTATQEQCLAARANGAQLSALEHKKVEQRDQENKALHAELDGAHKRMAALQEDNRKLTNANQIVREQRNAARMEAITAERKRVYTEAMLKSAERVLLQRQGELNTVRQVLDLTKSEGKRYAFRSGRAREWLQRLEDYVDGNPEYSYADLVSGIRQELARKD